MACTGVNIQCQATNVMVLHVETSLQLQFCFIVSQAFAVIVHLGNISNVLKDV